MVLNFIDRRGKLSNYTNANQRKLLFLLYFYFYSYDSIINYYIKPLDKVFLYFILICLKS